MNVPLVDLKAQYDSIKDELDAAIHRVAQSGQFILGPEVKAFEEEIAAYCETQYAVGVASGTDASHFALVACGSSIGRYAFIGAGSVVTKDVPDYALVYGNPARIEGWVCECGVKLNFSETNQARCPTCGKIYQKSDSEGIHLVRGDNDETGRD
jgi:hypothetical protein